MERPAAHRESSGPINRQVIAIDQAPIGRTLDSNPAHLQLAYSLRYVSFFALLRNRGTRLPSRPLSFNVKGGTLGSLPGTGTSADIEMNFLPMSTFMCTSPRQNATIRETLGRYVQRHSISDVRTFLRPTR